MAGGKGKDTLDGGSGDDLLDGGRKPDQLTGGNGDNTLTGGSGPDRFVFDRKDGDDTVTDWESRDTIVVENGARGFGKLDLTQTDEGVLVSWKKTSVLLLGVDVDDLGQEDFDFG